MIQTDPAARTDAIWREFHERLRAFVSRRVARPADAEDILQEVFIRIHRGAEALHSHDRLLAWIFQVTRNAIADHFRAGSRQADALPGDFDPPERLERDDGRETRELSACLRPMIDALPDSYREAILLTEIEGLTQLEAAGRSGVSLSGMKSRVQRGRRQLKEMLLGCCRVELDRRGGVVDYVVNPGVEPPCGPCGPRSCGGKK